MEKDYLTPVEFAVAIRKSEVKAVGVNKTKVIPKKELEKVII